MTPAPHRAALLLVALAVAATPGPSAAADALPDGFYRYPSIGGGTIVFASEGDLWKVPAAGGVALRLTAHEGEERFPRISPDGRLIAFTAQYEGNDDVYVMPVGGGEPQRLTFHPASDQAIGWTPDGKVLFRSRRDHPHGDYRVYTIPATGGIPQMIPLEPAAWVSFEPGGSRIALQKIGLEFHNWKRYKGGEAEDIWVGALSPLSFTEVTRYDGKDAFPMWAGDGRIYFVTDRWGRPNLASMLPDGSDVRRLTRFDDYDVRWPSMGDGKIVYQHKMDLWTYDLATGKNEPVPVQLPSDRLQVRERFVEPLPTLRSWSLSKDGERLALEARGDVFVARTRKKGLIRRITESSLARTRTPVFSPDGKTIAAWTEVDGEEQLVLHSADNGTPPRALGTVPPGWHFAPAWSPDGKSIAWGDEKHKLFVSDVATGAITLVDTSDFEIPRYFWSPDSRYLAYAMDLPSLLGQVKVWDGQSKKAYALTEPAYSSFAPAWDPKGKYLFFLSDRFINPYLDRLEARFIVNEATLPFVVALQADGALPFAPRGDVDPPKTEERKDEKTGEAKGAKAGEAKTARAEEKIQPIRIDFDGLADRVVQVPVAPGNYTALRAVGGKLHWLKVTDRGMTPPGDDADEDPARDLVTYDIEKEKLSTVASGVRDYDVSMDGKVLVYRTKDGFVRVEAGATEAPKDDAAKEAKVDLSGWTIRVNPRDEWKQMLHEAWRLQRDFFYDPKMHGVDWDGVWRQYGPLADRISSRDDLADMLGEVFGELNVGHAYHGGGDVRRGKPVGTGLLAADLDYDPPSGFWQIRKIYRGDYPDPKVSSPLARPDLHVKPGQWLVAIDGRPLIKGEDYLRRLASRAGQEVELSIADAPRLEGARRVVVKTVDNDTPIRYATWIRETREYVDRKTNGQIGYIHLYDMGGRGLQQFARDFPPQWNRRGLIMDDRWNHGGFVAPMILAHLDRKILAVG
ncbi:MAG TPA: PDZ domain-containing protein, partial [Thermoanaerobaculia bacterium]|nr:PDZ domain-containing protein [Thermoanaerobaculia bacterium]